MVYIEFDVPTQSSHLVDTLTKELSKIGGELSSTDTKTDCITLDFVLSCSFLEDIPIEDYRKLRASNQLLDVRINWANC